LYVLGRLSQHTTPESFMTLQPDFLAHQARLLSRLAPDEAVLLLASPTTVRNGDAEHRYRPASDLFWLTGWEEPEAAAFFRPGDHQLTLFVRERDPAREQWTGRRQGLEGAVERFDADEAFPYDELGDRLPELLRGVRTLHYDFTVDTDVDAMLVGAIQRAERAARQDGQPVPTVFPSLRHLLHELRLVKDPDEIALLREAARITALGHAAAFRATRPGVREYQVAAAIDFAFANAGSTGLSYETIVAGGENACILHYVDRTDELRDGDLVLIDAGAEHAYYAGDVTRTFPVNGRFTADQRRLYNWVLRAEEAAIAAARVGARLADVHQAAVRVLAEALVELGVFKGSPEVCIASGAYKRYFVHGTSHWLGLDVHDVGTYTGDGGSRVLEPGMVFTIEPGLYFPANDEAVPEAFRGVGIRIEDDVHIRPGPAEVLTAAIPKTVDAIEAACARE